MIGTSAMSSNSSIASAARPTGLVVPAIGSTSAVEDSASASPSPSAPDQYCPIIAITSAISAALPISSIAPSPNTSRRIAHNRSNDSSSPIENSSRMIPNSANGAIASGSVMVTWYSHGTRSTIDPSP